MLLVVTTQAQQFFSQPLLKDTFATPFPLLSATGVFSVLDIPWWASALLPFGTVLVPTETTLNLGQRKKTQAA